MAIVGAGAVGCEFADVFNAFGSKVTLVDVMPTILPLEDAEVAPTLGALVQEARDRRHHRRQDLEREGRRRTP